jgi:hypothetical protein
VCDLTATSRTAINPRQNGDATDRQPPRQKRFVGSRISEADGNQTPCHNSGVYGFLLRFRYGSRKTIRFARGSLASRQCEMQRDREMLLAVGNWILRQEDSCFFRPVPAGRSCQPLLRRARRAALVVRWSYRVPSDARFRR